MAATDEPFEKTMRLVCRLDDEDIDYVKDTAEWIRRFVAEARACDPSLVEHEVTAAALDMSLRGRYRLMKPEIVAAQLAMPTGPAPLGER